MELTQERLHEVLHYDPDTGVFTWLKPTSNRVRIGQVAGNVTGHQYSRVRVDGRLYYAHRLAVFYMTGEWPANKVDHHDTAKLNNIWTNLREASNQGNSANISIQRNNTVGFKGVSRDGNSFRAQIMVNRKFIHLGTFKTPEDGHAAYVAAALKYFGIFANDGVAANDNQPQRKAA